MIGRQKERIEIFLFRKEDRKTREWEMDTGIENRDT